MMQSQRASHLLLRSAQRALSCCAAAGELQTEAPRPGTVTEYSSHVLIRLPASSSAAGQAVGSVWPELVEREPAVLAGFQAVAKYQAKQLVSGTVKITAFQELQPPASQQDASHVDVLAFPAGLRWDGLSVEQVGLAIALAAAINPGKVPLRDSERRALAARQAPVHDLTLLVCCHAARDARCGQAGPPLAAALQRAVRQRQLEERVHVLATSHVGGHKFAGNVLCYGAMHPCDGDWFGGLTSGSAEAFLDALLGVELGVDGGAGDPALRQFWRGRMGLSKEQQLELFEQEGAIEDLSELRSDAEEGGSSGSDDEELEALEAEWRRRRGER